MKRYLKMALAGLLVAGMVGPALAADIKVTGQVRQRYRYWNNMTLDSDIDIQPAGSGISDRNYFDIRVRFGADAKLSEGVRARIELERYFNYGTLAPNVTSTQNPMNVRQAWMDFQIPGLPEGWRAQMGRSFFSLGHQYVYGNSLTGNDGIQIYGPLGPGTLKGYFSQTNGGFLCCLGQTTGGGVTYEALSYKFDVAPKHTVELYGMAGQDKGIQGLVTTAGNAPGATNSVTAAEFWVGGAYSGAIGPVALKFEGAYQGGKARQDAAGGDITRSAGLVVIDGNYKIIPEWNVGINISWATGDSDGARDNQFSNFVSPLALFATSPSRVMTDSGFFNGNRSTRGIGNAATNRLFPIWGRGTIDSDITSQPTFDNNGNRFSGGLRYLKFYTKYAFSPKWTGWLNIVPMWADENPTGIGRFMGGDVDIKIGYKPYPNIVTNIYAGFFYASDFFNDVSPAAATSAPRGTSNAVVFRWEALVTF